MTQEEFVAKHAEVLKLRKQAEKLRYDLLLVESDLKVAERESSFLFHQLFDAAAARS